MSFQIVQTSNNMFQLWVEEFNQSRQATIEALDKLRVRERPNCHIINGYHDAIASEALPPPNHDEAFA